MNIDPDKAIEAVGKNLPITEAYRDLAAACGPRVGAGTWHRRCGGTHCAPAS